MEKILVLATVQQTMHCPECMSPYSRPDKVHVAIAYKDIDIPCPVYDTSNSQRERLRVCGYDPSASSRCTQYCRTSSTRALRNDRYTVGLPESTLLDGALTANVTESPWCQWTFVPASALRTLPPPA